MTQQANCPVCDTRQSTFRLENQGCWYCQTREDEMKADDQFEAFMALDKEERWRLLWEAAGQPSLR